MRLGRLPGEHFADNLGDPQRGGSEWDHNHRDRDSQLLLYGVRQLGGPVQEAERASRAGPPQPGQERTPKEDTSTETIVAAQNQNPGPHWCERHRQMVTDNIPLHLLPLQPNLLALLYQLMHTWFLNPPQPHSCYWMREDNVVMSLWIFFIIASADFDERPATRTVRMQDLSTQRVFYKDMSVTLWRLKTWDIWCGLYTAVPVISVENVVTLLQLIKSYKHLQSHSQVVHQPANRQMWSLRRNVIGNTDLYDQQRGWLEPYQLLCLSLPPLQDVGWQFGTFAVSASFFGH